MGTLGNIYSIRIIEEMNKDKRLILVQLALQHTRATSGTEAEETYLRAYEVANQDSHVFCAWNCLANRFLDDKEMSIAEGEKKFLELLDEGC